MTLKKLFPGRIHELFEKLDPREQVNKEHLGKADKAVLVLKNHRDTANELARNSIGGYSNND